VKYDITLYFDSDSFSLLETVATHHGVFKLILSAQLQFSA